MRIRLGVLGLCLAASLAVAKPLESVDVDSWGYRDVAHSKYSEYYCLRGFSPLTREYRDIESREHSKELSRTYYRFTLIKETYAMASDAEARLRSIREGKFPNSKASKECAIRGAFIQGSSIYQVHSDVGVFGPELRIVMEKFEDSILPSQDTGN